MVVGDSDQCIYKFRGADYRNMHAVRGGVPRRDGDHPRAELPVEPEHPRRRQRGDRQQRGAPPEAAVDRAGRRRAHHPLPRRRRARRGARSSCTRSRASPRPKGSGSATSRSSTAPTRRAAWSRKRSCAPACRTASSAALKFYDRREVKDMLAYLRALVNPDDEVSWRRVVNTPKRGVGDTSVNRVAAYAQEQGITFRDALGSAAAAGVTGKALGGVRELLDLMGAVEHAAPSGVARDGRGGARVHRLPRRARGRRTRSRPRGASRTCRSSSACAGSSTKRSTPATCRACRRSRASARRRTSSGDVSIPTGLGARAGVPRGDLARHRPRLRRGRRRRAERGHAHDAALGEGARVPGRVPARPRGRHLPARAQRSAIPTSSRRNAGSATSASPAARERLYLCHAWSRTLFGATDYYPPSRFLSEIPEELVHVLGEARPRRSDRERGPRADREAVVSAAMRSSDRTMTAPAPPAGARGAEQMGLRVGDDVAHDKFGEGVIIELIGDGRHHRGGRALPRRRREAPAARVGAAAEAQRVSCISRNRRIIATT